jgi:Transglycosylase SLT domain
MVGVKLRRRAVALLCIATSFSSLLYADDAVPSAYRLIAAEYGIPVQLFYAVALAESGKTIESMKHRRPWPWTLNIAGQGVYFSSRWQAWRALDQSLRSGQDSVDIGLMQVNWRFHEERLGSSWLALEPHHNLAVGAEILRRCYLERRDWWASVGCYHAPSDNNRAQRYRAQVAAHWRALTMR